MSEARSGDEQTFRRLITQVPVPLAHAALLLSREIAYPDLDVSIYLDRLAALAAQARARISPHDTLLAQAESLVTFLFHEQGFRGNTAAYFDPRNSHLNEVLDRRLGIPISLSLLFMEVARQLGLPANGVGMPGHFIVSLQQRDVVYYFDPFNDGARLTVADCARLVKRTSGYQFREAHLAPTAPRDILIRMLHNLRNIYVQNARWPEATAVIQRLVWLQPGYPQHLRDLGLVHFRNQVLHLAAYYLDLYFQRVPHAPDMETLQLNLRPALEEWVRLN